MLRLPSFTYPQSGILGRMWESFSFGWHVYRYLKTCPERCDVLYANSWPICSQAFIAKLSMKYRVPLILHVQDIYPESLQGKLPQILHGIILMPLETLDRWTVRQASRVIVISESMRLKLQNTRNIGVEKYVLIRNWQDEKRFELTPDRREACMRYGIPKNAFTFLYFGNIGPVAGVEYLIEAFRTARIGNAQLVIAGDGSAREACRERVRKTGTVRVHFISDPEVDNVPLIQCLGHVCLLPLCKRAGVSSIPSKLITYMLSAKPILAAVDPDCDTAGCIREARCGWIGDAENVEWLSAKMAEIASLPITLLDEIGQRGRSYGLKYFSKAEGVKQLANVILEASTSERN